MRAVKFEDMIAWQKARTLTLLIYKKFKEHRDFGFKDQITRASVSIMNNIAEGFERNTVKEFRHFLHIAKGSCGEVRSMLHIAKDTNKITDYEFNKFSSLSIEISKLLYGFIQTLSTKHSTN